MDRSVCLSEFEAEINTFALRTAYCSLIGARIHGGKQPFVIDEAKRRPEIFIIYRRALLTADWQAVVVRRTVMTT